MAKKRPVYPRCMGVCADSQQCGRRVTDGSVPPLCHLHVLKAKGLSNSPVVPGANVRDLETTPISVLRRLMRTSSSDAVRLKCADLLLDYAKHGDLRSKDPRDQRRLFIASLTPDERLRLGAILNDLRTFKEDIYATRPDLRLSWETASAVLDDAAPDPVVDEPALAAPQVEAVTSESPAAVLTDDDDLVEL